MSYPQDPYQPAPEVGGTAGGWAQPQPYTAAPAYPPTAAYPAPQDYPAPQPYAAAPTYPAPQPYPAGQTYTYPTSYHPKAGTTNGFAIAGFVLSLLGGSILGVIFAIVALSQISKNEQKGRGLAIAAIVITAAWVVIGFAIGMIPAFMEGFSDGYNGV